MILIGTVHEDFDGPDRLSRLLVLAKPDKISLEVPTSGSLDQYLINRQRKIELIDQVIRDVRPSEAVAEYFRIYGRNWAYELFTAAEFAKKSGASLHFVDSDEVLERQPPESDELRALRTNVQETNKVFPNLSLDEILRIQAYSVDLAYTDWPTYEKYYRAGLEAMPEVANSMSRLNSQGLFDDKLIARRDQKMAIIKVLDPDVHISGLFHLQKHGYDTGQLKLYELVGEGARIVRLCDVDEENFSST